MSTSLIVELDAKTAKLDKALDKTNRKLDKTEKNTTKADLSLKKMSSVAGIAGAALTKTAVAGLALATALTAVVLKSAASQQELSILSRQAKLSTDDFEALAFATKQYGVNAEQIADISKDLADKMGEYSKRGTGAFQDYADQIGLTKEQAKKAAVEFENMSSDHVIGEMVRKMEEAGASGNEMTSVLESMGNDLSKLIPLFTKGAKELDKMTSMYAKATKQMKLSSGEIADLQKAATSFDLMTDSLAKSGALISAQIAPLLDEFFNSVIEVVPKATQAVVNFINTFRTPAEIGNLVSIQSQLADATVDLHIATIELAKTEEQAKQTGIESSTIFSDILKRRKEDVTKLKDSIEELTKREAELEAQRVKDAETGKGGTISATLVPLDKTIEQNEAKEQAEQDHQDRLAEIKDQAAADDARRESDLSDLFRDSARDDAKSIDKTNRSKEQSDKNYFNTASTLADAFFEDNKAIKAGLVVVDTAAGISKSFAELPYPAALAASASIAATGVAQLAAIQGASKGGGSVSSSGTTSAPVADTQAEPTSSVTVSDSDVSGESQSKVIVAASADDIAIALNELMNGAKVSGVI